MENEVFKYGDKVRHKVFPKKEYIFLCLHPEDKNWGYVHTTKCPPKFVSLISLEKVPDVKDVKREALEDFFYMNFTDYPKEDCEVLADAVLSILEKVEKGG